MAMSEVSKHPLPSPPCELVLFLDLIYIDNVGMNRWQGIYHWSAVMAGGGFVR